MTVGCMDNLHFVGDYFSYVALDTAVVGIWARPKTERQSENRFQTAYAYFIG